MEDKYTLDDARLKFLVETFNRSKSQTQELYNLVDGDFDKLIELEHKIKRNYVMYCPGSVVSVNRILKMK